jgi:phosphinothricin acetyltransferase
MGVVIRSATEAAVPAILDIYNYYILNTVATFDVEPQTLEEKLRWFRETRPPHCIFVAEEGGEVVGFSCLRPFRVKAAYRLTAENSVYVHSDRLGRGIGTLLMAPLLEAGRANGFHSIIAGVALPNPASVKLHSNAGFTLVGVEQEVGYKFERWVDVAWMQVMLSSADGGAN